MTSRWTGSGPDFELAWGNQVWRLELGNPRPGLIETSSNSGPLLSLHAVTDPARVDRVAFAPGALQSYEARFDFVEALYIPAGWHSLRVRARWIAPSTALDTLDLEVQLQADTVDELQSVGVSILSMIINPARPAKHVLLSTAATRHYLQMSHPDDTCGDDSVSSEGAETSLFGYDLERGVVLRGRLRGVSLSSEPTAEFVTQQLEEFIAAPPPLGP